MKRTTGLSVLLAFVPACVSSFPDTTLRPMAPAPPTSTWAVAGTPPGGTDAAPWYRPPAPAVEEPRPPRPEPIASNEELDWRPPAGSPAASPSQPSSPAAQQVAKGDTGVPLPPVATTSGYADQAGDKSGLERLPAIGHTAGKPGATAAATDQAPFSMTLPPPPPTGPESLRPPQVLPSKAEKNVPPDGPSPESPAPAAEPAGRAPIIRLVNSKRITVNFEVKDVGPSGVAAVDLWYTRDCKTWRKHEGPPQGSSYVFQVPEEGLYGFTLVAKSGVGIAKDPPVTGDLPQLWVVVDLTRPKVQVLDVTPGASAKDRSLTIRWKAADANLGHHPIALSYAEKEGGPWVPIASNLENTGSYVWTPPASAPAQVVVRVEATDLAGNVGQATFTQKILLDTVKPVVAITDVGPNN